MQIPIGINAPNESKIVFSANAINLPEGIKVFLEDKELNLFTKLNESSTYEIILNKDENDIGRFYIHTSDSALNIDNNLIVKNVSVYVKDKNTLTVSGLNEEDAKLKLYSLLGKELFTTSFKSEKTKNISLPILAKGVYLVEVIAKEGRLNKKVILK